MAHAVAVIGGQEKYSHIFTEANLERNHNVLSDAEQYEKEQEKNRQMNVDFFGLGENASQEEFFSFLSQQYEENLTENAEKLEPVKEEELESVSDEELEAKFEASRHFYKKEAADRQGLGKPSWSQSTETVAENRVHVNDFVGRDSRDRVYQQNTGSRVNRFESVSSSGSSASSSSRTTSSSSSASSSNTQSGTRKAMDEFQRMNASVQRLGSQRTKSWTEKAPETEEEYFTQFANNAPWWKKLSRKGKRFLKSGRGRITMKMGAVLLLQMCMAVYGKKYEFENKQQMFGMFTLMLASFFLSKELAEEGMDVSGLIF